jgi:hypothetical protein
VEVEVFQKLPLPGSGSARNTVKKNRKNKIFLILRNYKKISCKLKIIKNKKL